MASDYNAIRTENERRYGTDIGRIGPMLLAHRYADRTHFIFELLQNAEDALTRRPNRWRGSRTVTFGLRRDGLKISHYGEPFNEGDVRGICGIAESTKDLTSIGRFGIGFKSVYAFTNRPEIHSGTEDFAIENFVWPIAAPALKREPEETIILIPLDRDDEAAQQEIATGLGRLGPSTLLFLRNIDEINWRVEGGQSGVFLREARNLDTWVRQLDVVGQERGRAEVDGRWLVFSRPVRHRDRPAGHVEIAFSVAQDPTSRRKQIQRVERSPLVVFFPTVLETHLGFLVQGPYRTTPSRDNVPRMDIWNQHLVKETASLLVDSLGWLRDHKLLGAAALRCLPIDAAKFGDDSMFGGIFEATKKALSSEPLLPRFDDGHVAAKWSRLARTQELRDLLNPSQVAKIFGKQQELVWLSADITQDRTPELRRYLIDELGVDELIPESIALKLTAQFLKSQTDAWMLKLYEFLNGQPAIRYRLDGIPLVRLEDGSQVTAAQQNGHRQAFLPGKVKTGFPTVRESVCGSDAAYEFLESLGLTEPDPVDDVVLNLLPKYVRDKATISSARYDADIKAILTAFATDSKAQREKLISALKETPFVMVTDAGDGSKRRSKPDAVYLATERLKQLFVGISRVFLLDDSYACLRGEDTRELLEACGATRYLQPIPVSVDLSWEERSEIRRNAGLERSTWGNINDVTLRGVRELLKALPDLDSEERREKAKLLWETLIDLENRRGSRSFSGEYTWGYGHTAKTAYFDADFVRQLNSTAWIPKPPDMGLELPELVIFDSLGWKPSPFLQSKIHFKPAVIETLAREAGIEPGVLDLLKKFGLTSEAELKERLGLSDEQAETQDGSSGEVEPDHAPRAAAAGVQGSTSAADATHGGNVRGEVHTSGGKPQNTRSQDASSSNREGSGGSRPFFSYVGVHNDDGPDPDGLDHSERIELETKAIDRILLQEPFWERTPTHNPGFDLYELDDNGNVIRWCEVKAMTGSMEDRPVGLSHTQFACAQEHRENYWLYIVERAGDDDARILRIQDPAGKARTFTFDRGWINIADVMPDPEY